MVRNKYDIDEELESPFNFSQIKRVSRYMRPYLKKILFSLGIMIIASALNLLSPLILMVVINNYLPNKDLNGIFMMSGIFACIVIICAILMAIRVKMINTVGQSIIHDIRLDMFRHLQELSFSYFDDRPHGKILVRIVNYVNSISDLLSNGVVNVIVELISLFIILGYMLLISPTLTLYALAGIPLFIWGTWFLKGKQRRAQQQLSRKISNINAYTHESLIGMKVTQAFVREEENRNIFHKLSWDYRKLWIRTVMLNIAMWPYIETTTSGTVALLFSAGALWLSPSAGKMLDVGIIVAFTGYIWRFWSPINTISSFYTQLLNSAAYIERIFEFLDEPVLIRDKPGTPELPMIKGKIEFKNVTFWYDEGIPVLENLSFTAVPGDSIALVGPTGAGKSTIVNLLCRFYDIQSGEIKIDDYDIRDVTLDSLRTQMGIMLQDPYLFPGTIMDNIRYGRLDATDEECMKAAKGVCADGFIKKLPDGYMTLINEQGSGVSAGEKQLISFARVLLSDPRILILDEATASIDTKTEQALQKGLDTLLEGRTSFIIAHRLSTIRKVKKIMYIADKSIVESGTHEELMESEGKYYNLYQSQFNAFV